MRAALAGVLLVSAVLFAKAVPLQQQHVLEAGSDTELQGSCACGWASTRGACGNDDGTPCWWECCKGGTRPIAQPTTTTVWNTPRCAARAGQCGSVSRCQATPGKTVVRGLCDGDNTIACCVDVVASNTPPGSTIPPSSPVVNPPTPGLDPKLTQRGVTTRYWDCCKPACAWPSNTGGRGSVKVCAADGVSKVGANTRNVCTGGGDPGNSYTCTNQQPWAGADGYLYGFVATQIGSCCDCFLLQFTEGVGAGRKMYVQRTNTGGDLSQNQFDIHIPGGGPGIFNGCAGTSPPLNGPAQWGSSYKFGATYGGVATKADCAGLPAALQPGCRFRFDYIGNNPHVNFAKVTCPAALTAITGCQG